MEKRKKRGRGWEAPGYVVYVSVLVYFRTTTYILERVHNYTTYNTKGLQ